MEWNEVLLFTFTYVLFTWLARFVFIALIAALIKKSVSQSVEGFKQKIMSTGGVESGNKEGEMSDMRESVRG